MSGSRRAPAPRTLCPLCWGVTPRFAQEETYLFIYFWSDKFIFTSNIPLPIQTEEWKIQSYLSGVNFIFES